MIAHLNTPPTDIDTDLKKVWAVALLYWIVTSFLCLCLYPVTISDVTARYAPMADHFAHGEWTLAFHPRFGVLFQILSGSLVALTGLSGDSAAQLVSLAFVALAAPPLFLVVRDLFGDRRVAWAAVALLLVSDDFTRHAFDGLRDTGKCLAFALLGLGALRRSSAAFALGLFILVTLVSYGFAIASVFVFCWCVWALFARRFAALPLPVFAWTCGTAAVVALTHAFTGHFLPSPHFIKYLGAWL